MSNRTRKPKYLNEFNLSLTESIPNNPYSDLLRHVIDKPRTIRKLIGCIKKDYEETIDRRLPYPNDYVEDLMKGSIGQFMSKVAEDLIVMGRVEMVRTSQRAFYRLPETKSGLHPQPVRATDL